MAVDKKWVKSKKDNSKFAYFFPFCYALFTMATKKSGGSTQNGRDSNPKYLGVKVNDGQATRTGSIIVRQRGTDVLPGRNIGMGKDHTLFALTDGIVKFSTKRKIHFDNSITRKKIVHVVAA